MTQLTPITVHLQHQSNQFVLPIGFSKGKVLFALSAALDYIAYVARPLYDFDDPAIQFQITQFTTSKLTVQDPAPAKWMRRLARHLRDNAPSPTAADQPLYTRQLNTFRKAIRTVFGREAVRDLNEVVANVLDHPVSYETHVTQVCGLYTRMHRNADKPVVSLADLREAMTEHGYSAVSPSVFYDELEGSPRLQSQVVSDPAGKQGLVTGISDLWAPRALAERYMARSHMHFQLMALPEEDQE